LTLQNAAGAGPNFSLFSDQDAGQSAKSMITMCRAQRVRRLAQQRTMDALRGGVA
jgi:hypothetical protein